MSEPSVRHTPGPWTFTPAVNLAASFWIGTDNECVACSYGYADQPRNIANAHLIAAAPDLLAALKRLLGKFENCARRAGNDDEVIADATAFARAAVAKAEGAGQ